MKLFGCIRLVLVEETVFFFICQVCNVYGSIIRNSFEAGPVKRPCTFFCRKLFYGLGNNEGTVSQMVEGPVVFRAQISSPETNITSTALLKYQ